MKILFLTFLLQSCLPPAILINELFGSEDRESSLALESEINPKDSDCLAVFLNPKRVQNDNRSMTAAQLSQRVLENFQDIGYELNSDIYTSHIKFWFGFHKSGFLPMKFEAHYQFIDNKTDKILYEKRKVISQRANGLPYESVLQRTNQFFESIPSCEEILDLYREDNL